MHQRGTSRRYESLMDPIVPDRAHNRARLTHNWRNVVLGSAIRGRWSQVRQGSRAWDINLNPRSVAPSSLIRVP